jgi:hypothetical protein
VLTVACIASSTTPREVVHIGVGVSVEALENQGNLKLRKSDVNRCGSANQLAFRRTTFTEIQSTLLSIHCACDWGGISTAGHGQPEIHEKQMRKTCRGVTI